jgi:hypothetical protein
VPDVEDGCLLSTKVRQKKHNLGQGMRVVSPSASGFPFIESLLVVDDDECGAMWDDMEQFRIEALWILRKPRRALKDFLGTYHGFGNVERTEI